MQAEEPKLLRKASRGLLSALRTRVGMSFAAALLVAAGATLPALAAPTEAPGQSETSAAADGALPSSGPDVVDEAAPLEASAPSVPAPAAARSAQVSVSLDARWSNAVDASVKDYHYNGSDLSHIYLTPQDNAQKTVGLALSAHVVSDTVSVWKPGTIRITLPSRLFSSWAGDANVNARQNTSIQYDDQLSWSFAQAPAQPAGSQYNYTDNGDGTITLTNFADVAGSNTLDFGLSYTYRPSFVKVGPDGTITNQQYQVTYQLDSDGDGTFDASETTTRALLVDLTTSLRRGRLEYEISSLNKADGDAFLAWQPSWGARPADASDYFYVVWHAQYQPGRGTSIGTYATFKDTGSQGEFVGMYSWAWRGSGEQGIKAYPGIGGGKNGAYVNVDNDWTVAAVVGEQRATESSLEVRDDVYPTPRHVFVLKRYPRSMLEEAMKNGTDVTVSDSFSVDEKAYDGQSYALAADAQKTLHFSKGEGSFGLYNRNSALMNYESGRTFLLDGNPVRLQSPAWGGPSAPSFHLESALATAPAALWNEESGSFDVAPWQLRYEQGAPYYSQDVASGTSTASQWEKLSALDDADYFYRGFSVSFAAHGALNTPIGAMADPAEDTAPLSVSVYIRKAGSTEWTQFATVTKTNKTYAAVDMSGTPLATYEDGGDADTPGRGITLYQLPADVAGIRYEASGLSSYAMDLSDKTSMMLRPTAHLKGLLQAAKDAGSASYVTQIATQSINGTQTGISTGQNLGTATYRLSDLRLSSHIWKTASAPKDVEDYPEGEYEESKIWVSASNSISSHEQPDVTGDPQKDNELFRRYVFAKGEFVDLLPAGTTVDPKSVAVNLNGTYHWYTSSDPKAKLPKVTDVRVSFEPNYQESGMTLMRVSYAMPQEALDSIHRADTYTISLTYKLRNSYTNIKDRGLTLVNSAGFINRNPNASTNFAPGDSIKTPDNLSFGKFFSQIEKQDPDTTMYAQTTVNYRPVDIHSSGLYLQVASDEEGTYASQASILGGRGYSYRMSYELEKKTRADRVVLCDVFERGNSDADSMWQGSFKRLDVSALEAKPQYGDPSDTLKPVVYYSTKLTSDKDLPSEGPDLSDASVWSTELPKDKDGNDDPSQVTAIAIDCTKTDKGNDFILDQGLSLSAFAYFDGPTDKSLAGTSAVNRLNMYARTFMGTSAPPEARVKLEQASASVTVSFDTIDVTAKKTWNDKLDPQKASEVSLQLMRKTATEQDFSAVGEPVTTQGLSYTWRDQDEKDPQGNPYQYKVSELNVPEQYEVTYDDGIARGNAYAFGITNTLRTVDVSAAKSWSGGADADHGEVRLQLLRSVGGEAPEAVGKPVETEGLSVVWEGVPELDQQGRAYVYSVAELSTSGEPLAAGDMRGDYRVSYGVADDGTLTVKNEFVAPPTPEPPAPEPTSKADVVLPRTGDEGPIALLALAAAGVSLGLVGLLASKSSES
ncbi:Cna B-type domain-containing protein [Olsenella sp. HMSC062G07]|uniref:Cna B-type domain-containing protein n=1 Tax=Olsenella sp. HMSC062G07 TaxID=1739330 RepID=UPI000B06FBA3|nr:Cna B-type domain-containing protein [Olsenella sp. HMSC062G07]